MPNNLTTRNSTDTTTLEKRTVEHEKRAMKQGKEMDALKAENADLKARLEALERRIGGYALARAE